MEIPVPVQPSWLRRASAPLPGLSVPGRLFDQRFGEGLLEAELASLCPAALAPYYLRAPSVALPTAQVPGLGEGHSRAAEMSFDFSVVESVRPLRWASRV